MRVKELVFVEGIPNTNTSAFSSFLFIFILINIELYIMVKWT